MEEGGIDSDRARVLVGAASSPAPPRPQGADFSPTANNRHVLCSLFPERNTYRGCTHTHAFSAGNVS